VTDWQPGPPVPPSLQPEAIGHRTIGEGGLEAEGRRPGPKAVRRTGWVGGPELTVAPKAGARLAQGVVGLPVPRVFSSSIPPSPVPGLAPGPGGRVPFPGRMQAGVVAAVPHGGADALEPLDALLDAVPALTEPLLALAAWAATQTASAWGE